MVKPTKLLIDKEAYKMATSDMEGFYGIPIDTIGIPRDTISIKKEQQQVLYLAGKIMTVNEIKKIPIEVFSQNHFKIVQNVREYFFHSNNVSTTQFL